MAATGNPLVIPALASSGTVVSTYKIYAWVPDSSGAPTATPATLYTDADCATPASNPATLGASVRKLYKPAGTGVVIEVKSSDGATTYDTIHYPVSESTDATLIAIAALSFSGTNSFLRATASDTFVAENAANHRTALSVPGTGTSNTFTADNLFSTGAKIQLDVHGQGSTGYAYIQHVNSSPYDYLDIVSQGPAGGWSGGVRIRTNNSAGALTTQVQVLNNGGSPYVEITNGGLVCGAPTGSNKGTGTVNATAVYDDNSLLTCYPIEAFLDGSVDLALWDTRSPTGVHIGARRFAARLGTEFDPLDIDKFADHWKQKRHLTAFPNKATYDTVDGTLSTGEWVQRLIETVEIQAIHIEQLNQRLKVLEGAAS